MPPFHRNGGIDLRGRMVTNSQQAVGDGNVNQTCRVLPIEGRPAKLGEGAQEVDKGVGKHVNKWWTTCEKFVNNMWIDGGV